MLSHQTNGKFFNPFNSLETKFQDFSPMGFSTRNNGRKEIAETSEEEEEGGSHWLCNSTVLRPHSVQ